MTKDHHCPQTTTDGGNGAGKDGNDDDASVGSMVTATTGGLDARPLGEMSKFLTTSRMLRLFSAGMRAPPEGGDGGWGGTRVIYMDGAWDMFHCGHVSVLKEAKNVRSPRSGKPSGGDYRIHIYFLI